MMAESTAGGNLAEDILLVTALEDTLVAVAGDILAAVEDSLVAVEGSLLLLVGIGRVGGTGLLADQPFHSHCMAEVGYSSFGKFRSSKL